MINLVTIFILLFQVIMINSYGFLGAAAGKIRLRLNRICGCSAILIGGWLACRFKDGLRRRVGLAWFGNLLEVGFLIRIRDLFRVCFGLNSYRIDFELIHPRFLKIKLIR